MFCVTLKVGAGSGTLEDLLNLILDIVPVCSVELNQLDAEVVRDILEIFPWATWADQ